ncbi:hypothetical protein Nepgr_031861 [Nepenthes gracilis]|uniref:Uncharacterized protein n=1 Tax=Nepenthes gracilis TaxID=150966 RepID=A0AAD3THI7_NEPGR|nr:hypothetical protein Nepgr_031861 [Nepenthes gracilis]
MIVSSSKIEPKEAAPSWLWVINVAIPVSRHSPGNSNPPSFVDHRRFGPCLSSLMPRLFRGGCRLEMPPILITGTNSYHQLPASAAPDP